MPCTRDSDSNIFTSLNQSNSHYIGKHPGVAFMEMQFYPPGWVDWPVGNSCDATKWCAALNIDSFSEDMNTGTPNSVPCLNSAGIEPVNFAFLTHDGVATAPANPLDYANSFNLDASKDFFMKSGDQLAVHLFDTSSGFTVVVQDLTQGTAGKMVASRGNGFGSIVFNPHAKSCTVDLHGFHPEYSTSSPSTRVTWAADSYNVAFSDEIGHFEYCGQVDGSTANCLQSEGFDTNNPDLQDDNYCLPIPGYPPSDSTLIQVKGCLGVLGDDDVDFDGVPYDGRSWPGSITSPAADAALNPTPIRFSSPTTVGGATLGQVAFETDLPRIEDPRPDSVFGGVQQLCQRFADGTAPPPDPNPDRAA